MIAIPSAIFTVRYLSYPIMAGTTIRYVGIGLIWMGIALRLAVVRSLGRFFTVDVTIREGHRLKTDGCYRYLRHPAYAASLLSFIGFGVSLNNWAALSLITVALTAVFVYRVRVEEKVLTEQFGAEYMEYKKHTYAMIPFIY